jgi:hypothetical protein
MITSTADPMPNAHLRPAEAPAVADDGLSQLNPLPVSEIIRLGQEAMARKRRGWEDWLAIAAALQVGRAEVMRDLHTKEPRGRRFEKAMSGWLIAHAFKEIDKGTRCRLLECLAHRIEIEKWRSRLTDGERFAFNHPDTVLRKWKAATVVPDPNKPLRVSPQQKLKDDLVAVIEERDRYKREVEHGGGDLFNVNDTNEDIVTVLLAKFGETRSKGIIRAWQKRLKDRAHTDLEDGRRRLHGGRRSHAEQRSG